MAIKRHQPELKESDDPRVGEGEAEPFQEEEMDAKVIHSPLGHREGFTKRDYLTPCGRGNFGKGLAG